MLKVGQKLFVPAERFGHSADRTVVVETVGRKWAKVVGNAGRIDMETMRLHNGYTSPKVYTSKKVWLDAAAHEREWYDIKWHVARTAHHTVTKEGMDAIRAILKI